MFNRLSTIALWCGAVLASLIPGVIAFDSGGVFPWSYWALSAGLIIPTACAFVALKGEHGPFGLQPQLLTLALMGLGLFALFQTVALPSGMTKLLSPGSYEAWSVWLPDQVSDSAPYGVDKGMPISVAPYLTRQYAWILFSMAAAAWCGAMLFSSRERVAWLLIVFSMIGTVHAMIGLWQVFSFPNYTMLGLSAEHPFGVFVNRNNAATIFNLSLACSLGLLGWRLAAVTGHEFGQHGFSFTNLFDLASDRPSLFAFAGVFANIAGLLACGSRGGFGGAIVGVVLGLGMLKISGVLPKLFSALLVIAVLASVLLFKVDVTQRSLERFGAMADAFNDSVLTDDRLPHWKDSSGAAVEYLPMGAGMGAYRYAYLPHQELGAERWFLNADNLWLEGVVEGGIFAILLALAAIVAITYSLLQIRSTPDPMDHGIATAGWVALFSMGFSQIFDFGLLLAGSAALTSILFGAVLGRASTEGLPLFVRDREEGKRIEFIAKRRVGGSLAIGIVSACLLLLASFQLRAHAKEDAVVGSANSALNQGKETGEILADLESLDSSGTLNSDVTFQKSRILGNELEQSMAAAFRPSKELKVVLGDRPNLTLGMLRRLKSTLQSDVAQELEPELRQRLLGEIDAIASEDFEEKLKQIRETVYQSLALSPLSSESRLLLLSYTFDASRDDVPVQQLYEEILALRPGTSRSMGALARLAGERGDWEIATAALRSLVARQPQRVKRLLEDAMNMGHPDPIQIVTDDETAIANAVNFQFEYLKPAPEFYAKAVEILTQEYPEDRVQRAVRYEQVAELYARLGEAEKAYEFYLKAIDLNPRDLNVRLAYIDTLVRNNEIVKAKHYAEDLTQTFGDSNTRLTQTINRLTDLRNKSRNNTQP
jgi:tetratricopeptide (TPR) repeat protein